MLLILCYTHTHTHIHTHTRIHTHTHTITYIHTYTQTHIYTYTHTHTHTHNVNSLTHISGNTLDLIITPILNNVLFSKPSLYSLITDHYIIKFSLIVTAISSKS